MEELIYRGVQILIKRILPERDGQYIYCAQARYIRNATSEEIYRRKQLWEIKYGKKIDGTPVEWAKIATDFKSESPDISVVVTDMKRKIDKYAMQPNVYLPVEEM